MVATTRDGILTRKARVSKQRVVYQVEKQVEEWKEECDQNRKHLRSAVADIT